MPGALIADCSSGYSSGDFFVGGAGVEACSMGGGVTISGLVVRRFISTLQKKKGGCY